MRNVSSKPPFNDPRVRKAVVLATDREQIIDIAAEGWGVPGGYSGPHTPSGLPLEELKPSPPVGEDLARRQAEATRLLAEAGQAPGVDVESRVRRGPLYERGALSRPDDLKKVGSHRKRTLLDTAAFRDRNEKGDFQAYATLKAVNSDDPVHYDARFTGATPANLSRYCNPEFDKLLAEQSRTFAGQKRAESTRQRERLLLQEVPDDRGFDWKAAMGYWSRVQQWPPSQGTTVYNFGKLEQVWCQGGQCR